MEATTSTTKIAWIHDGPPGVTSLGHFNCPCGSVVRDVEYAGARRLPVPLRACVGLTGLAGRGRHRLRAQGGQGR